MAVAPPVHRFLRRHRRTPLLVVVSSLALGPLAVSACAEDADAGRGAASPGDDVGTPGASGDGGDARADALAPEGAFDAACAPPKPATTNGETCIGFGKKPDTCDPACGHPLFGYVCFGGGPPGIPGCVQVRSSSLGETYCCADNACVAQPDQDGTCSGTGKPHRFQCPPRADGAGSEAPPPGCVEMASGETALEKFFCCP